MDPGSNSASTHKILLLFRIKGGVILNIWHQVIFSCLCSAVIVCIHKYVPGMAMDFPMYLVSVLGIVIGLLLVFRTNTAYDRYWEGRKIWATMTTHVRILTRSCWLGIKDSPADPSNDLIAKISAINVLVAFAYATKNYLREEYSYDADDEIQELISHIPKFYTPTSVRGGVGSVGVQKNKINLAYANSNANHPKNDAKFAKETTEAKNGVKEDSNKRSVRIRVPDDEDRTAVADTVAAADDAKPLKKFAIMQRITMSMRRKVSKKKYPTKRRDSTFMAHDCIVPTNVPLELIYYFQTYVYSIMDRELVDGTTVFVLMGSVNNLMDSLTQFERILRTPIPLAYSIHLHHSLWLYLLSLPFQLVGQLGWFTIAAMGLASFALLGILAIGWEIENPFGYDDNDLPLDDFCEVIRKECSSIVGRKLPDPDTWIFSPKNHPFIPKSYQTASELKLKPVQELLDILSEGKNNDPDSSGCNHDDNVFSTQND